jgi:ubiquinone/menaquinone biosynthesis C-methylase UbiE
MTAQGSLAGLETFDKINIDYERAYENNSIKKACIAEAIALLTPGSRVLDVGCGTGVPVSSLLSAAGFDVTGFDISPKMVALAQSRVKGTFSVSDMLTYTIEENTTFMGIFIIYSQLQLNYQDFYGAAYKYAQALQPGGYFVIGQSPSNTHVAEPEAMDETHTYAEGYNLPFMGEDCFTLLFSEEGQKDFLRSMGLEVVWELIDIFQPNDPKCNPERQQYVIAKRVDEKPLSPPKPLPKKSK